MITVETLEKLARQHQTALFPNIVREYYQHLFLEGFYQWPEAEQILFKGGTAIRVLYGSPRFSEDLDFSLFGVPPARVKSYVEELFVKVLAKIEQTGIAVTIDEKSDRTTGGYFGKALFTLFDFKPVGVEINISSRKGKQLQGEVDTVANDFVPTYTVVHLPQEALVEEKIFGALVERKKPRDFYDLYFMMRKGMLSPDQKKRLAGIKDKIISDAKKINFRGELGAFLPANQQTLIRDFTKSLESELNRQTGR